VSFDSLQAFVAMDGHGGYVWSSYALALGVVVFIIGSPLRRRRRFLAEQASRLKRSGADRDTAPAATPTGPGTAEQS
jgi:heme exporter protein D